MAYIRRHKINFITLKLSLFIAIINICTLQCALNFKENAPCCLGDDPNYFMHLNFNSGCFYELKSKA